MKEIRINCYRVVIEVPVIEGRRYGNVTPQEAQREAENITRSAKRHLCHDHDLSGMAIESDTDGICEHCDSRWTEDSVTYNGGCCDEDEKANPENAGERKV